METDDFGHVGQTVGEWQCDQRLGTGAFGIVHVWSRSNGDQVAIKTCKHLKDPSQVSRWRQEVDVFGNLRHVNIVKSRELPVEFQNHFGPDPPVLCMDFCDGGNLRQVLSLPANCCGLVDDQQVKGLMSDISSALSFLHGLRIIHRDIKPENIVLQSGGGHRTVYKLIDLGYAKQLSQQSSLTGSLVGTVQYVAPELFLGQSYTKSVDYWSLGLLTHEVVTGHRPFLPEFGAGQWLEHVERKEPNVIAIQEVFDLHLDCDEVVSKLESRTGLPAATWMCHSFSDDLVAYLRALLDWNPATRGRNAVGDIVAFSQLEQVLQRKRLLFCPIDIFHGNLLEYGIDERTTVSDLKRWLSEDLRCCTDQIVIINHSLVQEDIRQLQKEVNYFVHSTDAVKEEGMSKVALPTLIQSLLRCPRLKLNRKYFEQAAVQAHHFVRSQFLCARSMTEGLTCLRMFLNRETSCYEKLKHGIIRAEAKLELFEHSLAHDVNKYGDQAASPNKVTSSTTLDCWLTDEADLANRWESIKSKVLEFEKSGLKTNSMPSLTSVEPFLKDLEHLSDKTLGLVSKARKGGEGGDDVFCVSDIAAVVVKCLKVRDEFVSVHQSNYEQHLDSLCVVRKRDKLCTKLMEEVDIFASQVTGSQVKRQAGIWRLFSAINNTVEFELASKEARDILEDNRQLRVEFNSVFQKVFK